MPKNGIAETALATPPLPFCAQSGGCPEEHARTSGGCTSDDDVERMWLNDFALVGRSGSDFAASAGASSKERLRMSTLKAD